MSSFAVRAPVVSSALVGSVIPVRKGLKKLPGAVLSEHRRMLEVALPSGELVKLSSAKVSLRTYAAPDGVRSHAGRLRNLLTNQQASSLLAEPAQKVVSVRLEQILAESSGAIGLLLDRRALGLTPEECLALPLDAWRIRYELLNDHPQGTQGRVDLARLVASDSAAPLGERIRLCLVFDLDLALAGDDAVAVFGQSDVVPTRVNIAESAMRVAEALEAVGAPGASVLRQAVETPEEIAEEVALASVVAALTGSLPKGQAVMPIHPLPLSVIDDLIDAGIPIATPVSFSSVRAPEVPEVPLADYLTARVEPPDLSSQAVADLHFHQEAYRRFIAGDASVAPAIATSNLPDAHAVRMLLAGETPSERPTDPRLAELVEIIQAPDTSNPSDLLLADESVWALLLDRNVVPEAGRGSAGRFRDLSLLRRARQALFEWEWDRARETAREGLRSAKPEAVRDELLNIVACSLWLQDQPEPALAALDKALEGEYTDALLTNAAVVAHEMDHDIAIERFVRLARDAPGPHQRAMAAERALMLWASDEDRVWEDEDDEDDIPLEIRDALRSLIAEPLPEDRYVRLLRTLAVHDDDWLAGRSASNFGEQASTPAVRIFKARAKDLDSFVKALEQELSAEDPAPWIAAERDLVVGGAIDVLLDRNDEIGAAFFGLALLESSINVPASQRVPLICLTVSSISQNIDPKDGEPKDIFIDWVVDARQSLSTMDEEARERFSGLVAFAGEALARSIASARYHQMDQAIDLYNQVMSMVSGMPARRVNQRAVREAMDPIRKFCRETDQILRKVLELVVDSELRELLGAIMKDNTELGNRAARLG